MLRLENWSMGVVVAPLAGGCIGACNGVCTGNCVRID